MKPTIIIAIFLLAVVFVAEATAQWVKASKLYGGAIVTLAVCGDTLFAAPRNGGGVLRSTNGGTSWLPVNEGFPKLSGTGSYEKVNAIVVIGSTVIAGTIGGVSLSTNYGGSWTDASEGLPNSFLYDSSKHVGVNGIAMIGQNLFAGTDYSGVFLSNNNSSTWTPVNSGLPYDGMHVGVSAIAVVDDIVIVSTGFGIWRSTNQGSTWVSSGWAGSPVYSLAVSSETVYAGGNAGAYRSTDRGISWAPLSGAASTFSSVVYVLAKIGSNLFAGNTSGVRVSTDDGATWTQTGLTHTAVFALAVSGTNLLAGTEAGIFRSSNTGTSWINASAGIEEVAISSIAIRDESLFAATPSGVFLSIDRGSSWAQVNNGLTRPGPSVTVSENNILTGGSDVFLSTNDGTEWTMCLPHPNPKSPVVHLVSSGKTVLAGFTEHYMSDIFYSFLLSTNSGWDWAVRTSAIPGRYVNVVASMGLRTFAGTDSGLFVSTNNGESWTSVNGGFTNVGVRALAVSETSLFAGTSGAGVHMSADKGQSWSAANTGLTDSVITSLASSGANLFVGTCANGVFLSTNTGTTWASVNSGQTNLNVYSLAVNGTTLFTVGNDGLWRRPLSEMITSIGPDVVEFPHEYHLAQNYPNPCNPSTSIRYSLPKRSHVSLAVFNTLGQQVAVLQNGEQEAGHHDVRFDASSLPSGVYFYRLQVRGSTSPRDSKSGAGSYTETRKLCLVR